MVRPVTNNPDGSPRKVVLLVKDPYWLHAYWESQLLMQFNDPRLTLELIDTPPSSKPDEAADTVS